MNTQIEIVIDGGQWPPLDTLRRWVSECLAAMAGKVLEPNRSSELSLLFCDDANIQSLNKRFRGLDKPTNVLSFEPADQTPGTGFLGDLALGFETIKREADAAGLPLKHHTQHLIVHGILHLCGYDHIMEEDASVMEGIEVEILSTMGLHNPYLANEPVRV
ncbi:MAG: rRNA maturation RNase YbeY [Pseudomonadota bacterium]